MTTNQPQHGAKRGLIGLGIIGGDLLLNRAYHGFGLARFDKDAARVGALRIEPAGRNLCGGAQSLDFNALLRQARANLPALEVMTGFGFVDGYPSSWPLANLTRARRDYFGAHTYERTDAKGTFHTE